MSSKKLAPQESFSLGIFDATARSEKGDTLHLLHPITGEPVYNRKPDAPEGDKGTPVTISMYGKDSNLHLDLLQENVRRAVKAGKVKKGKKVDAEEFDIRESIEEVSEKHARMIFAWTGFEENGQAIQPTFENIKNILIKYKDVRTQVIEFFENKDGENFIEG